jgi:hypothetical protein
MADALALGASARKGVEVRLLSRALHEFVSHERNTPMQNGQGNPLAVFQSPCALTSERQPVTHPH